MSVNFYLRDDTSDRNGDRLIRVSINISGARIVTSSGQKISPDKWDKSKQRVRKGCYNSSGITYNAINTELARISEYFARYESECITQGVIPDVAMIRAKFNECFRRKPKKETKGGVFDDLDAFMSEASEKNQWAYGTKRKFITLRNHLRDFDPGLTYGSLDERRLTEFMTFLRESAGLRNSSVQKTMALLRWFLRWAARKGYCTNRSFEDFAPKLKTTAKKVHFLSWDELMRVNSIVIPDNGTVVNLTRYDGTTYGKTVHDAAALDKTRDIFCFCCFTSLRYSDAMNLRWTDVGEDSFTITTVKTADMVTIDLNKYSREILGRYRGSTPPDGYVFPRISNQRMNLYIKEVCELCEINQPVTTTWYKGNERVTMTEPKYRYIGTHAGRRTFICNALILGIPPQVVMKWTGHSDYKAMKPYIDITNEAKAKAMAKFDEV